MLKIKLEANRAFSRARERQWKLWRANVKFTSSQWNYRGIFIIKQNRFRHLSIMSEKLLWKGWWIMITNTAALMQLTQVCIFITLMTFIALAYWISKEIPSVRGPSRKKARPYRFSTTLAIVTVQCFIQLFNIEWTEFQLPFTEYLLPSTLHKGFCIVLSITSL